MDTNCTNCNNLKKYNKDADILMKSQEQTTKNVLDGWINFCKKLDHEKEKKETLTSIMNMSQTPMISIPLDEYNRLLKDSAALHNSSGDIDQSISDVEEDLSRIKFEISQSIVAKKLNDFFERR